MRYTVSVCGYSWNIIMPVLTLCVDEATSGCTTKEIQEWLKIVTQINVTLNQPDCSPCQSPSVNQSPIGLYLFKKNYR